MVRTVSCMLGAMSTSQSLCLFPGTCLNLLRQRAESSRESSVCCIRRDLSCMAGKSTSDNYSASFANPVCGAAALPSSVYAMRVYSTQRELLAKMYAAGSAASAQQAVSPHSPTPGSYSSDPSEYTQCYFELS